MSYSSSLTSIIVGNVELVYRSAVGSGDIRDIDGRGIDTFNGVVGTGTSSMSSSDSSLAVDSFGWDTCPEIESAIDSVETSSEGVPKNEASSAIAVDDCFFGLAPAIARAVSKRECEAYRSSSESSSTGTAGAT